MPSSTKSARAVNRSEPTRQSRGQLAYSAGAHEAITSAGQAAAFAKWLKHPADAFKGIYTRVQWGRLEAEGWPRTAVSALLAATLTVLCHSCLGGHGPPNSSRLMHLCILCTGTNVQWKALHRASHASTGSVDSAWLLAMFGTCFADFQRYMLLSIRSIPVSLEIVPNPRTRKRLRERFARIKDQE